MDFFRISFSLTLQREVTSPLASIGETIQIGGLSNFPFEYTAVASENGRTRELNFPNTQSTLLATEYDAYERKQILFVVLLYCIF
jgi:hypothetical protein